jgi:hypothetical protein
VAWVEVRVAAVAIGPGRLEWVVVAWAGVVKAVVTEVVETAAGA